MSGLRLVGGYQSGIGPQDRTIQTDEDLRREARHAVRNVELYKGVTIGTLLDEYRSNTQHPDASTFEFLKRSADIQDVMLDYGVWPMVASPVQELSVPTYNTVVTHKRLCEREPELLKYVSALHKLDL